MCKQNRARPPQMLTGVGVLAALSDNRAGHIHPLA